MELIMAYFLFMICALLSIIIVLIARIIYNQAYNHEEFIEMIDYNWQKKIQKKVR